MASEQIELKFAIHENPQLRSGIDFTFYQSFLLPRIFRCFFFVFVFLLLGQM